MRKRDDKVHIAKVNRLIHKIGLKYNLRDIHVKNIVESQFKLTRKVIENLDLEGDTSEQDVNFYFKYIGKLYLNKKQNGRKTKHSD